MLEMTNSPAALASSPPALCHWQSISNFVCIVGWTCTRECQPHPKQCPLEYGIKRKSLGTSQRMKMCLITRGMISWTPETSTFHASLKCLWCHMQFCQIFLKWQENKNMHQPYFFTWIVHWAMGASFGHSGFELSWVEATLVIWFKAQMVFCTTKMNLRNKICVAVLIILVASGWVDIVGSQPDTATWLHQADSGNDGRTHNLIFFFILRRGCYSRVIWICKILFIFWNERVFSVSVLSHFQDFLPVSQELTSPCLLILRCDFFLQNICQCHNGVKKKLSKCFL